MQWSNFYEPVNVNDDLTFLYLLLVLLMDCFICIVIVWYVDAIKPGDFGVPLPWYFPFTVSDKGGQHLVLVPVPDSV